MSIIFVRFRYLALFFILSTMLGLDGRAHAIGLGELHIQSGLGQALQANVRLFGIDANELNRSCVRAKVGTTDGVFLAQANIAIVEVGQGKNILMSTELRLNEPAIKITIDFNCEIQLHRDFLVLLDPPEFLSAILSNSPNADIKSAAVTEKTKESSSTPQLFDRASTSQRKFQKPNLSKRFLPQTEARKINAKTSKKINLVKLEKSTKDVLRLSDDTSFSSEGLKLSTQLSPQLEQQLSENMEQIRIAQRQMAAILRADELNQPVKVDVELGRKKIQSLSAESVLLKNKNKTDNAYFDEMRKNSFSRNWVIGLASLVFASLMIILILFIQVRRLQNKVEMSWWDQGREKKETGRRKNTNGEVDDLYAKYHEGDESHIAPNQKSRYVETEGILGESSLSDNDQLGMQETQGTHTPTLEESSTSIFNFFSSSGSSVKVEEISDITQEAEFWMSVNDPQRAIEILADQENVQHPDSPVPWLYLLDLYRLVKNKSKYDSLRDRFIVFFNAHIPEFDEKPVDVGVLQLEDYPHLIERICQTWGGNEIIQLLENLLVDDREGTRTGFELPVYRDILLLISIAHEVEKMRAIDGSKANMRGTFQEGGLVAEAAESAGNATKLNTIEFEVINIPKNTSTRK